MSKNLIIAIDGPAGSGKSTTAKLVAKRLNYLYIDTGAMYRAVTLFVLRNNLMGKTDDIIEFANSLNIVLSFIDGETNITVNGEDVSKEIRSFEVNSNVSEISCIEGVRKILVKKQQEMGKNGGVVMEGRDITTVVFPNATYKFYLDATLEERANRRYKQNKLKPDYPGDNSGAWYLLDPDCAFKFCFHNDDLSSFHLMHL